MDSIRTKREQYPPLERLWLRADHFSDANRNNLRLSPAPGTGVLLSNCRRAHMQRRKTIGNNMNIHEATLPALCGAGAGAVAAVLLGFTVGGWTTSGTAQRNVEEASSSTMLSIMTPYCVARAGTPEAAPVIAEIKGTSSFTAQRVLIEKAGWATPVGATEPVNEVAAACLRTISAGF